MNSGFTTSGVATNRKYLSVNQTSKNICDDEILVSRIVSTILP